MIAPQITQQITDITAMETAFSQASCIPLEPFIKLPNGGTPPVLEYNMPQEACFTTYGNIVKYFPPDYFKGFALKVPQNNYFDMMEQMNTTQAIQLFHPNVAAPSPLMGQFVPFTAPLSYGMPNKSFAAGAFAHG